MLHEASLLLLGQSSVLQKCVSRDGSIEHRSRIQASPRRRFVARGLLYCLWRMWQSIVQRFARVRPLSARDVAFGRVAAVGVDEVSDRRGVERV